jgi:hypothetical protein
VNVTDIPSPPTASARTALLAKRFARTLEAIAGVLALASLWESWQLAYTDQNRFFTGDTGSGPNLPGSYRFAQFLQASLTNLAWLSIVLAAGFALELVALRAARAPEPQHDRFAPDRAVQADDTSPMIPRAGATPIPTIAPRRDAPITVPTITTTDDSVWRR